MLKKAAILGLAIFLGGFSVSCSAGENWQLKRNVVVSAANTPEQKTEETKKEELKGIKSEEEPKEEDKNISQNTKEVFLTFDDGPTKGITPEILDILKQQQVKATFFVIGKMAEKSQDIIIREKAEGHSIGNHSYSHVYKNLYTDPNYFVEDINRADGVLKEILGDYKEKLIRFPGGSFGKDKEIYRQAIIAAGYHFVDWNALTGDAEGKGNFSADKLYERFRATSTGKNKLIVLMHDSPNKQTTVQVLPSIIEFLKSQGYNFKTLE